MMTEPLPADPQTGFSVVAVHGGPCVTGNDIGL
ncbi:hypothetical protein FBZ91_110132 [Nitrospirillum viridazoti]|nr:hypothetical protein FBZ91_110132 [Nitrospirillum amazonense]